MKRLIAAAFVLALAACDPRVSPAAPEHHIGDTIRQQETAMNQALAAKDANAAAAFYAPDAQLFDPGSAPATTPEAVHNEFATLFGPLQGSLEFHTGSVVIPSSGDYAISDGTFTVSYTDPGTHQPVTQSGNYVTLWRHQDDGSWKIMRDISTPGAAEAPVSAPK